MIILGEKVENTNVLHIILGPETEFHFDLNGRSEMDITEFCTNMSPGDRCMLIVNRCSSEQAVTEMLQKRQAQIKTMQQMKEVAEKMGYPVPEGMNFPTSSSGNTTPTQSKTEVKKAVSNVKCPKCLADNSAIIIDGEVHQCKTCQQIEDGLKSKGIPPVPSPEKLEQIKKEVEKDNKDQKKSNFKYFRRSTDKKDNVDE